MSDRSAAEDGAAVDALLVERLGLADRTLEAALATSRDEGLPDIAVSPLHGRLLTVLARAIGSRRILEIGTLGGYSTICLARAVEPDGEVVTLELDAHHADVASANLERAGLRDRVRIMVGPAAESLRSLRETEAAPFDFTFIDADKAAYPLYLDESVALSRPGALIVADNVVRRGRILDEGRDDPDVAGIRDFLRRVGDDPRLEGAATQTVGVKGWDGFALVRVRAREG